MRRRKLIAVLLLLTIVVVGQAPVRAGQGYDPEMVDPSSLEPLIVVKRFTKMTTRKQAQTTYHERWVWDLGDGTMFVDPTPKKHTMTVQHLYTLPGLYRVTGTSYSNHGDKLRAQLWWVTVPPDGGPVLQSFTGESIQEPKVKLTLSGPKMWLRGAPSEWQFEAEVELPWNVTRHKLTLDPGGQFYVLWDNPGGNFRVIGAATLDMTYHFPEGSVRVWNTYLESKRVVVLTNALVE